MADAMVDGNSESLEPLVVFLYVGRRIRLPGDVGDYFRVALAARRQRKLMIFDVWIRGQKHHAPGMLSVFYQSENVPIKSGHLFKIVHVQHNMAKPFDLRHRKPPLRKTRKFLFAMNPETKVSKNVASCQLRPR